MALARMPVCCYAKGYWSFRFCPALAALSVLGSIASPPTTYTADLSSLRSLTGRCPGAVLSGAGDPASNAEGERRNLLRPHAAYHSLFGGWLLLSLPSGFHANMVGRVGLEPTERRSATDLQSAPLPLRYTDPYGGTCGARTRDLAVNSRML